MGTPAPTKDPNDLEPYYVVWCDPLGINNGLEDDNGELQGDTIVNSTWAISPAAELLEDSNNTDAITIRGINYPLNTVATVWLKNGNSGTTYEVTNQVVTANGRQRSFTLSIPVAPL